MIVFYRLEGRSKLGFICRRKLVNAKSNNHCEKLFVCARCRVAVIASGEDVTFGPFALAKQTARRNVVLSCSARVATTKTTERMFLKEPDTPVAFLFGDTHGA